MSHTKKDGQHGGHRRDKGPDLALVDAELTSEAIRTEQDVTAYDQPNARPRALSTAAAERHGISFVGLVNGGAAEMEEIDIGGQKVSVPKVDDTVGLSDEPAARGSKSPLDHATRDPRSSRNLS